MSKSNIQIKQYLLKEKNTIEINTPTTIIYNGHIPITCFYLQNATVQFKEKNRTFIWKLENCLLCYNEFIEKIPVNKEITLYPPSTLFYLNRDDILELLQK